MYNLWAFLLQTLTASGVAFLLLIIKSLLRDKLTPDWHFLVWSVLGFVLLVPAGMNGSYTLFQWRIPLEYIKSFCQDYSYIQVLFPFPIIKEVPATVTEWIFLIYVLGAAISVIRYFISYIRLRCIIKNGTQPTQELENKIKHLAKACRIKTGKVIQIKGLPTAFVCGLLHPVLVLPEGVDIDDKILLHELFHIKNRDTIWSTVICFLRCIHWCNPLLVYCANCAINEMESRCDQRVLEVLEGEERRDYGRILLSMTNEQYAHTPGCTGINNGGSNISNRIEALARFKRYPSGMKLVSICMILSLTTAFVTGIKTEVSFYRLHDENHMLRNLAIARSAACTTYAGAMDTYAKAVLLKSNVYRAMCAPEAEQDKFINVTSTNTDAAKNSWIDSIPAEPNRDHGYFIYNLQEKGDSYECFLAVESFYPPDGSPIKENVIYVAYQTIEAKKEDGRWIINPLDEFKYLESTGPSLDWGCMELPGIVYQAEACDFRAELVYQTVHVMDNEIQNPNRDILAQMLGTSNVFDIIPKPHGRFSKVRISHDTRLIHLGTQEERDAIYQVGFSSLPLQAGEIRPEILRAATGGDHGGSSTTGETYQSRTLSKGWTPVLNLGGGGSSYEADEKIQVPDTYAADLYINNKLAAAVNLSKEGSEKNDQ